MSAFLSGALLTAALLFLPPAVAALVIHDRGRRRGATGAARTLAVALAVGLSGLGVAALLGHGLPVSALVGLVLGGSVMAWHVVGRHWVVRGLLVRALGVDVGVLLAASVVALALPSADGSRDRPSVVTPSPVVERTVEPTAAETAPAPGRRVGESTVFRAVSVSETESETVPAPTAADEVPASASHDPDPSVEEQPVDKADAGKRGTRARGGKSGGAGPPSHAKGRP